MFCSSSGFSLKDRSEDGGKKSIPHMYKRAYKGYYICSLTRLQIIIFQILEYIRAHTQKRTHFWQGLPNVIHCPHPHLCRAPQSCADGQNPAPSLFAQAFNKTENAVNAGSTSWFVEKSPQQAGTEERVWKRGLDCGLDFFQVCNSGSNRQSFSLSPRLFVMQFLQTHPEVQLSIGASLCNKHFIWLEYGEGWKMEDLWTYYSLPLPLASLSLDWEWLQSLNAIFTKAESEKNMLRSLCAVCWLLVMEEMFRFYKRSQHEAESNSSNVVDTKKLSDRWRG